MRSLKEGLARLVAKLKGATLVDERVIREFIRGLQRELLKADVSADIVLEVSRRIEERVKQERVPPGFSRKDLLLRALYEELVRMLGGEKVEIPRPRKGRPFVILLVGIQGSGKTTTAAKLALFYRKRGYKVALVCADNYRPGAVDQLRQLAKLVGAEFYGYEGAKSSVELAKEGVEAFKAKGVDVIIVDTAGRHKEEKGLLEEMKEIADAIHPDEVMLVLDGTMGKQAGSQAEAFHKVVPLGHIIVTKLDGAARGGGALAAVVRTGAKIAFIGVGEKVDELEPFDPPSFVSRLLGMGDLKALVERLRAAELLDRRRAELLKTGKFTLLDFKEQLEGLRKLGPLRKILELIPGGVSLSPELERAGEESLNKWLAILNSMTTEELVNPSIISRSRMVRIARGSGTTVSDVRSLLKAYERARKMMRRLLRQRRIRELRGIYF